MKRATFFNVLAVFMALALAVLYGCADSSKVTEVGKLVMEGCGGGAQGGTSPGCTQVSVFYAPGASLDLESGGQESSSAQDTQLDALLDYVKQYIKGAAGSLTDENGNQAVKPEESGGSEGQEEDNGSEESEGSGGGDGQEFTTTIPFKTYKGPTNGGRPTYYTQKGRMVVGQQFSLKCGDVEKTGTTKMRGNSEPSVGMDWPDGTVLKNAEGPVNGIALLLPAKYAANPPTGCYVKL